MEARVPERPSAAPASPRRRAAVTRTVLLGVDFGTSFTKVVWRDWASDELYGVVTTSSGPFQPSIVWRTPNGRLSLTKPRGSATAEPWMKMRLADLDVDPAEQRRLLAMSVFFVGSVIRAARQTVSARFQGDNIEWAGGALGCPATYHDDDRLVPFRDLAAAAWAWAQDESAPSDLPSLIDWCSREFPSSDETGFEVRPEVAAAVDCFTMRPDASSGVYLFFDIGGGTLDGACFKLDRIGAEKTVYLWASNVASLGVEEACRRLSAQAPNLSDAAIRQAVFKGAAPPECDPEPLMREVRQFIARLIMKGKGSADWLERPFARPAAWRSLDDVVSATAPLPIFLGGGGMAASLYRAATANVWALHSLGQAGVPQLAVGELTPPSRDWPEDVPFHRFAVAYGLTRPATDAGDWKLPGQLSSAQEPTRESWRDWNGIAYGDNKDVYD